MKNIHTQNKLIIASSEKDANLYYITKFVAPDLFIFIEIKKKKYMLINDLEIDRAKKEARVHQIISISKLSGSLKKRKNKRIGTIDALSVFLKKKRVKNLTVPSDFPIKYIAPLKKLGHSIQQKKDPFFEEREIKTKDEIKKITKVLRHTEEAVRNAFKILEKSIIKSGKLYYKNKVLTSEYLKQTINLSLMKKNCLGLHSIVSCGKHSREPHNEGSGPIYANKPIVFDIFPYDIKTRYYADFSRTVVKGKASPKLKKMYKAVRNAQEIAFKKIRSGIKADTIHKSIQNEFKRLGFKTGVINGKMQGFFHGTGHGLGIEIHESPGISFNHDILKAGNVVTVEPGLYYKDVGGVRLEDVVVITKNKCINLTKFPKILEI